MNHEARSEHRRRGRLAPQSFLVGGLLLVNFPAAALYGLSAIGLMSQYTVRVINESGATIDSFVLKGPGVDVDFGPITVGDNKTRSLAFTGDGTLDFSASEQRLHFDGQIEGYVTGNQGGDATIRVLPDGKFEITKTFED
jgi:hypothetical protein